MKPKPYTKIEVDEFRPTAVSPGFPGYPHDPVHRLIATLDEAWAALASRPKTRSVPRRGFQPMVDGIDYDSSEQ